MKILIIDDDAMVLRMIGKILRAAGHEVLTAENGKRGMSLFVKEQPQIVVTDIVMPEQEGIETIVAMRRSNPNIRIIAMSGAGKIGNIDLLKMVGQLGADDVIAKPFRPQELLSRLRLLAPNGIPA